MEALQEYLKVKQDLAVLQRQVKATKETLKQIEPPVHALLQRTDSQTIPIVLTETDRQVFGGDGSLKLVQIRRKKHFTKLAMTAVIEEFIQELHLPNVSDADRRLKAAEVVQRIWNHRDVITEQKLIRRFRA